MNVNSGSRVTEKGNNSGVLASVIIPTYDRAQFLMDTIASISQQKLHAPFEIIVVDNAPGRELKSRVEALETRTGPIIRYVGEPRTGLHFARHAGAKAAQSDFIIFSEDDMYVHPSWLQSLIEPYDDPMVACVGGKCIPRWEVKPPDWLQAVSPGSFSLLDYGDRGRALGESEYVNGGNMSVRRKVLFDVGGFNPDGFADRRLIWYRGDGEIGLQRRIRAAGFIVAYAPKATMEHRMPPGRMTPAYLRRRYFDNGIEADYRNYRYLRPSLVALALRCGYLLLKWIRSSLRYALARSRGTTMAALNVALHMEHSRGQFLHATHLLFQPELRSHCRRVDYLD